MKLNSDGSEKRRRLSEFDMIEKRLLKQSATVYRALISTSRPFPNTQEADDMALDVWNGICQHAKKDIEREVDVPVDG